MRRSIWYTWVLLSVWAFHCGLIGQVRGEATPAQSAPATQPGAILTGIVLNRFGGGVAEARIRIESPDSSVADPPLAEGLTNGFGDIAVPLPAGLAGAVRVRIHAKSFAEHLAEIILTAGEEPPFVDATLEGTGRLTGQVLRDKDGRPIGGAKVRYESSGRTAEADTDRDGRFTIEHIEQGGYELSVEADGFGRERRAGKLDGEQENYEIRMRPERPVRIIVADNFDQAAPGVQIEILVEPTHDYLSAVTDTEGVATLKGVPAAAQALMARMNGPGFVVSQEYSKTLELPPLEGSEPDREPIRRRVVIRRAAVLAGQITAASDGRPIPGVRVIAGREWRPDQPLTWTGSDGKYQLEGLEPGATVISCQHNDFAAHLAEVRLISGQTTELSTGLSAGTPIGGTIVDAQGKPLPGATVEAVLWNGFSTLGLRQMVGNDGQWFFPNAPPGPITFRFLMPGYGPPGEQILTAGQTDHRTVIERTEPEAKPGGPTRPGKFALSDTVPDLTVTTTDGRTLKLSELQGKYVILDCWASWCGPCIGEVPNLKALREATRDRADIVMLGISLDRDRAAFQESVKEHELDWPQVFGPKSGGRELFEALDGEGIPYICLIGPDGKLLAQHLRGEAIKDEVLKHIEAKE